MQMKRNGCLWKCSSVPLPWIWASIEHKVKYKKSIDDSREDIVEKLKECAEGIRSLDLRMQEISEYIDGGDYDDE